MPPKQFGPYVIEGPIGSGGMGEVFRASDSRLGRTVAIKVIPPHLAARSELRQRFEIEARAIASLNHPHICALFDIGEQDGAAYMVMEFLEGQSLADRLKKGPLPLEEALRHAIHTTDALDQAHRRGVYHRDIKPGNMMLTKQGVKLLDFGLARLRDRVKSVNQDEPTVSLTQPGTVLGTPQYMCPEQAEGRDVDGRGDVFSFASVLYESITGRKAFPGKTMGEVMSAVMRCEPPPLIEGVPASLNRALRICWARDPDERWQSAGDLRREIEWIAKGGDTTGVPAVPPSMPRREMLAWGSAVILGAAATTAIVRGFRSVPAGPDRVRFTITDSPPAIVVNRFQALPSISPDGKLVALAASAAGRQNIWIRALESTEMREIPGNEAAGSFFWSPDSRWLGFFAGNQLKRISPAGGQAEKICDTPIGSGATWNNQGVIVFQKDRDGALYRVAAGGGTPEPATMLAEGQAGHTFPTFLPDGKTFLFSVLGGRTELRGVFAATLGSTATRRISTIASNVRLAASGHLLFTQRGNLVAQVFDSARLSLEGETLPVANNLWTYEGAGGFDISTTGNLVYAEVEAVTSQLTWFDRVGRPQGKVGPPGPFIHMDLSRDGRRVLVERYDGRNGDLWMVDTDRGIPTPIASDPGNWSWEGHWSPDGTEFVYALTTGRPTFLYRKKTGATGLGEKLRVSPNVPAPPTEWSPDGKYIVFRQINQNGIHELSVLDISGQTAGAEVKTLGYLSAPYALEQGRISPDGRWMAFASAELKSKEIFVASFPRRTNQWRISRDGGIQPCWREDGKELFFLALDGTLMSVPMPTTPDQAGAPVALFRCNPASSRQSGRNDYAAFARGQRFLINNLVGERPPQTLQVIVGWRPSI